MNGKNGLLKYKCKFCRFTAFVQTGNKIVVKMNKMAFHLNAVYYVFLLRPYPGSNSL